MTFEISEEDKNNTYIILPAYNEEKKFDLKKLVFV